MAGWLANCPFHFSKKGFVLLSEQGLFYRFCFIAQFMP